MKKFFLFRLILAFVLLFTLVAWAPLPSKEIQLPDELIGFVGILVMVAITAGAKWLGGKIGVDISGEAAKIAAAISAILVLAINYLLELVPVAYDNVVSALFAFLIVFLGGAGFYSLFLRKKTPAPVAATSPVQTDKKK